MRLVRAINWNRTDSGNELPNLLICVTSYGDVY